MNTPHSPGPRRLLVAAASLCVLAIACYFLVTSRSDRPGVETREDATREGRDTATPADGDAGTKNTTSQAAQSPGGATPPVAADGRRRADLAKLSGPLLRTPEGRIDPAGLADFQPVPFPGGEPAYDGEKVTAYIAVPSTGKKVALTVNQLGEFPRIQANESEQVEILLAFTDTKPGSRVALAVQDGGKLHTGKLAGALPVDDTRQLAFAFTVSPNPGMHRVSASTQTGELKTLEFWAGPPPVLMHGTAHR